MTVAWMDAFIDLLRLAMMIGIVVLAILLYWHLRRIQKPALALIFWVVMFLTALTPLMQIVQSNVPYSQISLGYLFIACLVPMVIIGARFFNPLKPINYEFDDDEDSDEPFETPDQV